MTGRTLISIIIVVNVLKIVHPIPQKSMKNVFSLIRYFSYKQFMEVQRVYSLEEQLI